MLKFIKKWLGLQEYISPLDQFLGKYAFNKPFLSQSQREEVEKYQRIYKSRDRKNAPSASHPSLWDHF